MGTIVGNYYYVPNTDLPHRRRVKWNENVILRKSMSQKLQNSTGSIGTCCDITRYETEIEQLIENSSTNIPLMEKEVEDVKSFDERSLHKLFCSYLRTRNIYAKTIFHEKSSTRVDSAQKWVHPDIVGVQFEEFKNDATLSLLKATEPKESVHLYSYELKKRIDSDYQLKQFYFQVGQAIHEGFVLRTMDVHIDVGLVSELQRTFHLEAVACSTHEAGEQEIDVG